MCSVIIHETTKGHIDSLLACSRWQGPGDKISDSVPYHLTVLIQTMPRKTHYGQGVFNSRRKISYRVDKGAVQVENYYLSMHIHYKNKKSAEFAYL